MSLEKGSFQTVGYEKDGFAFLMRWIRTPEKF